MKKGIILHPLLFAAFPTLFIYAQNVAGFSPYDMARPLLVSLLAAAALWGGLAAVLRSPRRAALIVSSAAVLIAAFGHFLSMLHFAGVSALGFTWGPHTILIPVFSLIFATVAYFAIMTGSDLSKLTRILNVASGLLVALSLASIGSQLYAARDAMRYRTYDAPIEVAANLTSEEMAALPRIFYIVLDGYARSDNLKELFGYDNSEFIDGLRSRGFYIVENARANYSHTTLSLSSALNMKYLDSVAEEIGTDTRSQDPLRRMIAQSDARRFLAQRGYRFACLSSGFFATQIEDADMYLSPDGLREFETGLIGTTPAGSPFRQRARDRERTLFALEMLGDLAASQKPLFVLAHILPPHPPFVFRSDGTDPGDDRYFFLESANHLIREGKLTRDQYIAGYLGQVGFIEKAIIDCIDRIIETSPVPPLIILQSDHGSGVFLHHESIEGTYLQDRLSVLSAFHLPDGGCEHLYDSMTLVNTFRVIFSHYFDADMPLLEDRSYYATATHPFRHTDVTEMLGDKEDRARLKRLQNMDYFPDDIEIDARDDR